MKRRAWLGGVIAAAALGALFGSSLPKLSHATSCEEAAWELARVSEQTDDAEKHLEQWPERAVLFDWGRHDRQNGRPTADDDRMLGSLDEERSGVVSVTAHAP